MNKLAVLAFVALVAAVPAHAQNFPGDAAYVDLTCGLIGMSDDFNDEPGAVDERDLVGDPGNTAGMRAADASFLYMRMRVDEDPRPGGQLRPFSWGFLIDTNGDVTNYELLLLVDASAGGQGNVRVFRNTTTATANDPTDPAEMEVTTFPVTTHVRSVTAQGSVFGATNDFWLEVAIPWSTLAPLGFDRTTPIHVWAASSSSPNSLNGDFACHDGASGDPTLSGIAPDRTVGDPTVDTDGDGFTDAEEIAGGSDPADPDDVPASGTARLEGGGGCSAGAGGLAAALALLALKRRRRRSS